MSVVRSVKEKLGLADPPTVYRCSECDESFEAYGDPDSHWFRCAVCGARDAEFEAEP